MLLILQLIKAEQLGRIQIVQLVKAEYKLFCL